MKTGLFRKLSCRVLVREYDIQPGDVIVARKLAGIYRHFVVYLGEDENEVPLFMANMIFRGVIILDEKQVDKLMRRYRPRKLRRLPTSSTEERAEALQRAWQAYAKGWHYNPISMNCEHFVDWVQYKEKKSRQTLRSSLLIAGLSLGYALIFSQWWALMIFGAAMYSWFVEKQNWLTQRW